MTAAVATRAVYPRDTMKRLALLMGVPLDTARHWLYRGMCDRRRRELALKLLAECRAEQGRLAAIERRLLEWAAEED